MNDVAFKRILSRIKPETPEASEGDYLRHADEEPAFYFLGEILALRDRTPDDLQEIHQAKLAFPGCRVIQEGPSE